MSKKTTYLKDYLPPAWLTPETRLSVRLAPEDSIVSARLFCKKNPACPENSAPQPLILNGEGFKLESLSIDGKTLGPGDYVFTDGLLTVYPQGGSCILESVVHLNPKANAELEGLYLSAGNYCTQCEAEGFRKITFFPDRPDVMSVFTVTVIGDKKSCPVLLSNGNLVDSGDMADGLHFATWHDPFPKACYLFALVAGDLACLEDSFTTQSGRQVGLYIYTEPRNAGKCAHAMAALKKAMRWDEERFGREYDLERFMILAVDDFNMGAMENKGLNVFNAKYVLALPETATDTDFENIEGVIAHEYFHNWTGDRVTCRDWFQLSLKEGLTVFRDQEFTADLVSRPVKRICDADVMRSQQFREDAGPMAHPVRPASFVEINNFYTVTVYEKGAEVIRMMHTILGEAAFRRGMDLYFARHDGQAVTCDDFVAAMESASGLDLTQFKRWYSQAGTPLVTAAGDYDAATRTLRLTLSQSCPPTPEMAEKAPFVIPLALGLLDARGHDQDFLCAGEKNPPFVLLSAAEQEFTLSGISEKPVLSLLRNFSAPVRLNYEQSEAELALRMAHDSDPFNRWDAGQELALNVIVDEIERFQQGERRLREPLALIQGMRALVQDEEAEPAFLAKALLLPAENWIGQRLKPLDPEAIFHVRQTLKARVGETLRADFLRRFHALQAREPYRYNREEAGRRALKNVCLDYLLAAVPASVPDPAMLALGVEQYHTADNMTDTIAALRAVAHASKNEGDTLLAAFLERWRHDPLVMDKWLAIQASRPLPGTLARVRELMQHPVFSIKNPNKVRALIASFCTLNQRQFHSETGEGYAFLGGIVREIDAFNPQIAARMAAPFCQWQRFGETRQKLMREQLEQLRALDGISDDLKELVEKSLR